jgi:hypothetical protein
MRLKTRPTDQARAFAYARQERRVRHPANGGFLGCRDKKALQLSESRGVEGGSMASQQRVFAEKPTSREGNASQIGQEAIREELSRILESPVFVQSDRLGRFLRYTVETTLAGNAETLKEYLIGTEVYERRPPYHPNIDSIVRSEARRLRIKLKQYYESNGRNDSIFIYYRPGSYVPAFRRRDRNEDARLTSDRVLSELLNTAWVTKDLALSLISEETNLQIVFEGTVRILHSKGKSPGLTESSIGSSVSKRIQARKITRIS